MLLTVWALAIVVGAAWAALQPCTPRGKVGGVSPEQDARINLGANITTVGASGTESVTAGKECGKLIEFYREGWSEYEADHSVDAYASSTLVRGCGTSGAWGAVTPWTAQHVGAHSSHGKLSRRQYVQPPGEPNPWSLVSGMGAGYEVVSN